jgi:hypothetical protein
MKSGSKLGYAHESHAADPDASMEKAEGPHKELSEHELDMHHRTLMDAEAVKGNPHIMKQLQPHMEKKMGHLKKIMTMDDLKAVAKKKSMEG